MLTNMEKTFVIDALRERYCLKELLPIFSISKSSYCNCRKTFRNDRHAELRPLIRQLFEESNGRYGYRRINCLLHRGGIAVSEKIVRRLMKEEGLAVGFVRKKRYNSNKGEAPHLRCRIFSTVIFMQIYRDRSCLLTSQSSASLPARFIFRLSLTAIEGADLSWQGGCGSDQPYAKDRSCSP